MEKTPVTEQSVSTAEASHIRHHVTLFDKIKRRIEKTRLVFSVVSILLYTVFTVIMLQLKWGNTVYLVVIMSLVGLYVLLFAVFLLLRRKSHAKFSNSLKDYKSGLKILKSLLSLMNLGLTISIFIQAAGAEKIGTPFQIAVLIVSFLWALFQIGFQTSRMRKRHSLKNKKNKKA